MSKEYGSWSLLDLRNELKKRNAKVTGKKAVLVERLEDYDKLFGPLVTEPESDFNIVVPSPKHFHEVTSDSIMPALEEEDMETFCNMTARENISSLNNMYKENFLLSCRLAYVDGEYYVCGLCASEMRKNVSYNVTVKVKFHQIMETQCECAAGMGPYAQCKHILVLLFGIIDFNKTKTIKTKSSCTSNLQTFHHPAARYSGNIVEASKIKLKFKNEIVERMTTFDPRKENIDPKFEEIFNNLLGNFTGGNMPIRHKLKSADKKSMYSDHDYLKKTVEEQFFEEMNTEEELTLLRKPIDNKKKWLEKRRYRMQSSDFGKICKQKLNKMKLARSLVKNTLAINTAAIQHGIKYEKEAIKKYEEVTGRKTSKIGIIVHPENLFLGCTPDALVDDDVLEVKCPFMAKFQKITPENVTYIYLCEQSGEYKLEKSHNYYYQIQGQLMCSGKNTGYLFIYTICDYCIIKIERDNDFIEEMSAKLKIFYENFFKKSLLDKFLYS